MSSSGEWTVRTSYNGAVSRAMVLSDVKSVCMEIQLMLENTAAETPLRITIEPARAYDKEL